MPWTADDLGSLDGLRVVVTGANSGIGLACAKELAAHGADVTLACRDTAKGEAAIRGVRQALPNAHVTLATLDLASLDSVRAFTTAWEGPLDLLINNAGVMMPRSWQPTLDGFEMQFGTNHLGHFALTGLLLPALLDAPAPRVVTVSSLSHHQGRRDVVDGNPPERYRPQPAYGNSKLANLLFGRELQRQASAAGSALVSTMSHPGVSATNLLTSPSGMGSSRLVRVMAPTLMRVLLSSATAGARSTLYAATQAWPGSYTGPTRLRESRGRIGPAKRSALAVDDELAAELWARSVALTGVTYPWPA